MVTRLLIVLWAHEGSVHAFGPFFFVLSRINSVTHLLLSPLVLSFAFSFVRWVLTLSLSNYTINLSHLSLTDTSGVDVRSQLSS